MRIQTLLALLALLAQAAATTLIGGCQEGTTAAPAASSDGGMEAGPLDATPAPPPTVDMEPPACTPALTIEPGAAVVNPFGLATFRGGGGTGAYRFSLGDGTSGAIINALTGAYLAGPTAGARDTVVLVDEGCRGRASASVQVVEHIALRPASAVVPPSVMFHLDVSGGSGAWQWALLQAGSGGALGQGAAGGDYLAGPQEGLDIVQVTDTMTGETATAQLRVARGAQLAPQPGFVALPLGETLRLTVLGGSGYLEAAALGQAASYQDGLLTGLAAGSARIELTDVYTRQKAEVVVEVVAPQRMTPQRAGDRYSTGFGAQLSPGGHFQPSDLDGDGLADLAYGDPEANVSGFNSGALYLYAGKKGGPAAAPTRVIAGEQREDQLGRAVVVADLDGDGHPDLAVGAPLANAGLPQAGAVYLYKGIPGQLFADKPWQVLAGKNAYDFFGWSLAAGDVNGDGRMDLVVGAMLGEDTQAMPIAYDQGEVAVFLGYPDGFLTRPDVLLYGRVPDENGTWQNLAGLQFGYSIAVADVDGDGKDDLLASAITFNATRFARKPDSSRNYDGAAWVFAGVGPGGGSPGGLLPFASRYYAGLSSPNGQLGRHLTAADLDGDGQAEVILGQLGENTPRLPATGAARVFRGGPLAGQPPAAFTSDDQADATYAGSKAYTYLGFQVAVGEATGDGLPDLVVGHWLDNTRANQGGAVRVFAGQKGALPALQATRVVASDRAGDRLGQAVAVLGDADGDGTSDLFGLAGFATVGGAIALGAPWFIPGDPMIAPRTLDTPGQPTTAYLGASSALLDFNNDGFTDLAVGAPRAPILLGRNPDYGVQAGLVQVYLGSANGLPDQPSLTLGGFYGHSDGDWFGFRLAPAGDFDGDGLADLAVVARGGSMPYLPDNHFTAGCGQPRHYGAGAVYVFRGSARGQMPSGAPAFVFYGAQDYRRIDSLAGGFDLDHDGRGDLVVGSPAWNGSRGNQEGGLAVITGRPATPGRISIVCDPALVSYGIESIGFLGIAVSGVPDLDGDHCDEVAAGAYEEHLGGMDYLPYQGTVRVILGWGARCAARSPRMILLRSKDNYSLAGASLAAADLDRDGRPELAIGGWNHLSGVGAPGGAWVVPGSYLKTLVAGATVIPGNGDLPPAPSSPFVPPGATGRFLVEGQVTGEQFGQSVALLPDLGHGRGGLAVGAPLGSTSGVSQSGGVRVFAWIGSQDGLDPAGVAVVGGETRRPAGHLGDSLGAGSDNGTPALVVGAFYSSAVSLDFGSAFLVPLALP